MPGFLGGGGSTSGTGGEITFPKEFIDPVTKLRVSQPQNLIDTDFEYGLQPTKWETVELINNTPSFFSKSGDTTIPGIVSATTNAGTREITVKTALDHGLAVGIPINVSGTKSVTADGSYIINSIPNGTTFTYLCKDIQSTTSSIEDLYSSIITGEFFQGSQIRVSDSEGILTDGESISTLTVKTPSTHGFGVNTPFYFLNLNSTISQEFQAANTAGKSFDSSNSATAQTFDGSNTLSQINIDWSNSATVGGTVSTVSSVSTTENTITVSHSTENFNDLTLGAPLYYDVSSGAGYFSSKPRGVVFIKSVDSLGVSTSTFQVSEVPEGDVISLEANVTGTFQIANQARLFAGNNVNPETEIALEIVEEAAQLFDGANDGGVLGHRICTVNSYSGSLVNVTTTDTDNNTLDYYAGAMVRYSTDGSAASGLSNNTTYFIDSFFPTGTGTFAFTLKAFPDTSALTSISGGTGTQTFTRIGVSVDKDIIHVKNGNFAVKDMLRYDYPVDGKISVEAAQDDVNFYFVETAYDTHNFVLTAVDSITAIGGTITTPGDGYKYHTYTVTGADQTFTIESGSGELEVFMWGAGGGGSTGSAWGYGGEGGAGGYASATVPVSSAKSYKVVVGQRGLPGSQSQDVVYGGGGRANGWSSSLSGPGSGGGLTGLFETGTYNQANAVLIAGGGGGGGASRAGYGNRGGGGGGTTGQNGTSDYTSGYFGRGGSQTAGGASGNGNQCGAAQQNGFALNGGGWPTHGCYGGGGGGGYFGGGHGTYAESNTMGGGGGGSGYAHPTKVTGAVLTQANRTTPANSGSSLRGGAGVGGFYNNPTAGRLIIRYQG
jgi:hypothetical protein